MSSLDLANSIKLVVDVDHGDVTVGLSEELPEEPCPDVRTTCVVGGGATNCKKQKVEKEEETSNDKRGTDATIPESVLQYERHLRKIQAKQRSVAEISMEKHLKILYEDSDLIVVDKPSGVLCVPGINNKPNILQLVCQHMSEQQKTNVEPRSDMIAHRLDMDTSGLVVFCKNITALKGLQAAFRDRTVVVKEYHALLCGHVPEEWTLGNIHLPLQRDHRHPPFMRIATPRSEAEARAAVDDLQTHGFQKLVKKRPKPSHTEFRILEREYLEFPPTSTPSTTNDDAAGVRIPVTRVALTPHTGRTHQLRVHCAALGYPIVGDPAYGLYGEAQARGGVDDATPEGSSMDLQQQLNDCRPSHSHTMCLHAAKLGFEHPISREQMVWTAPTPF
jgi:tRNA pseudouridine32 synthase / 23S rRNA pseudouridine746 synthase